jgi:hypothetical protein
LDQKTDLKTKSNFGRYRKIQFLCPQLRPEAAYLYDAVQLYAKALCDVLDGGGDPRNGSAIIESIKGRTYVSAMG